MGGMSGAKLLIADFVAFSRRRSAMAAALIFAGAMLEGIGVVMLVPIVSLILDVGGVGGGAGDDSLVGPAFSALGLETEATRIGAVLTAFAVVLGLRFGVLLFRDDLLYRLQLDFVVDLRVRAFRQLSRMPWAEVAQMRQGKVGHALIRDIDRAEQGAGVLVHGTIAVVMLVVQLTLALALAPVVTMIVALLGLGLFRALRWLRDRAERHGRNLTDEDLALFQTVSDFLRGLKPAKAHGLESAYVAAFGQAAARVARNHRISALDFSKGRLILQSASGGIAILAILLGVFILDTKPESLIVTLIILARLYSPLQTIQNAIQSIRHAAPGYQAARAIAGPVTKYATIPDIAPSDPLNASPEILLEAVSWRGADTGNSGGDYVHGGDAGAPPVIDLISARIPAGQVTALIGESGAGKSTLCDLAVGLLAPTSGEVRLDAPPLKGVPLEGALAGRLRASLAYVGQEPFLFDDSLRNNLCWGCGPVSDKEIWQALETVGANDLAHALDGGLEGPIRTEGMRFSGGERQRLRLARALLRRPRLLVLDEATNALDIETEARVLQAVLAARDGATVLMVSHRPGNLSLADHVILLEAGRLAETGPVAELACDPATRIHALLLSGAWQPPTQAQSDSPAKK
jgi:ATP-binding cassette subfamily C protein